MFLPGSLSLRRIIPDMLDLTKYNEHERQLLQQAEQIRLQRLAREEQERKEAAAAEKKKRDARKRSKSSEASTSAATSERLDHKRVRIVPLAKPISRTNRTYQVSVQFKTEIADLKTDMVASFESALQKSSESMATTIATTMSQQIAKIFE